MERVACKLYVASSTYSLEHRDARERARASRIAEGKVLPVRVELLMVLFAVEVAD